jgi:hypothetical protein
MLQPARASPSVVFKQLKFEDVFLLQRVFIFEHYLASRSYLTLQGDRPDDGRQQASTRLHGATTQKTANFKHAAARTSNPANTVGCYRTASWAEMSYSSSCGWCIANLRAITALHAKNGSQCSLYSAWRSEVWRGRAIAGVELVLWPLSSLTPAGTTNIPSAWHCFS